MAQNKKKMTQQDKIEAARAIAEKQERIEKRKRIGYSVFVIVLCVLLIFAFCFPAMTTLITS